MILLMLLDWIAFDLVRGDDGIDLRREGSDMNRVATVSIIYIRAAPYRRLLRQLGLIL